MSNKIVEWKSKKMISVLSDYDFRCDDVDGSDEWFKDDMDDQLLLVDHALGGGVYLCNYGVDDITYFGTKWDDKLAEFYDRVLKG